MNEVLKKLLEAGQKIVPVMVPGAGPVLEAGKAILEAIEAGKDLFEPGDQSDVDITIRQLQAKVNEHFDDTISGLRGETD